MLTEVLRRAAHDWVLYRVSTKLQQRQLAEDAFNWLFREEPGTAAWADRQRAKKDITSFLSICDILSLSPDAVRAYVRGLTIKEVLSTGRPPTYRRQRSRKRANPVVSYVVLVHVDAAAPTAVQRAYSLARATLRTICAALGKARA